jgi:uncharacterized protein (DUF697 family)
MITTVTTAGTATPFAAPAIAVAVVGDALATTKIQLQLVATLADFYGCPLNLEDPEDVLFLIGFFLRAESGRAAGNTTVAVGRSVAKRGIKKVVTGSTRETIRRLSTKAGKEILQRHIIKASGPIVNVGLGYGFNYLDTRGLGRRAKKAMSVRARSLAAAKSGKH